MRERLCERDLVRARGQPGVDPVLPPDDPERWAGAVNEVIVGWEDLRIAPKRREGQAFAQLTVAGAIVPINELLTGIYGAAGMPVADVDGAFSTTDFATMVPLPPFGQVPLNVARVCGWTWVCAPAPLGPDNHANAAGYHAIAEAFAAVLLP